jgi:carbon monoxide dehydrogenase subunit G
VKLSGTHRFAVPRQQLWEALLDPEILARTLPGCESLERTAEHSFRGVLNVAIGPVKGRFQGTLDLSDLDPPNGYRMEVKGQGPAGFLKGAGTLRLEEVDGGTDLAYDLAAQVGGRLAAVGQRLLDSSAKVVAQQGLEGLAALVEAARDAADGAAAAPPPAPSQARMAKQFAGGLWRELVPSPVRRVLAAIAWLALGVLLGWWLRGWLGTG